MAKRLALAAHADQLEDGALKLAFELIALLEAGLGELGFAVDELHAQRAEAEASPLLENSARFNGIGRLEFVLRDGDVDRH